jgi:oxidase EvaA
MKESTQQKLSNLFFNSLIDTKKALHTIEYILDWIKYENEKIIVNLEKIPFSKLKNWKITDNSISHDSGKFFSIQGYRFSDNSRGIIWDQPIINQPEVGILGFVTKEINGVLHFLTQAKIEPGNVNKVQLSPTLQATKSNYTKAHKGKSPQYLDFFLNINQSTVLVDQLQSEQGARFYKKRNRNIIVLTKDDIEEKSNYKWLTLAQLKYLMTIDNIVNMDTRTVISNIQIDTYNKSADVISFNSFGLDYFDSFNSKNNRYLEKNYFSLITNLKSSLNWLERPMFLSDLKNWNLNDFELFHKSKNFFKVIAVDINIENREVASWSQPMIEPMSKGSCVFICQKRNGVLNFLVQLKEEIGLFDKIELGPTIQTSYALNSTNFSKLPFSEYVFDKNLGTVISNTLQSEEGGRFFHEENQNIIININDTVNLELEKNFIWITLRQLNEFIKYSGMVNIQARNLLAQISMVDVK